MLQSWHSSPECPVLSFSTAASAPTWPCAPGAAGMSKSGGQTPTSFRACGVIGEAPGQAADGMDTRPAGLAPVPGLSLCSFSLVPWRLCLSSAQFRGGDPAWHVGPDLPGGLVSSSFPVAFQHLSALLCWGLLLSAWCDPPPRPVPHTAHSLCALQTPLCCAPVVMGRVRRAEPGAGSRAAQGV